MSSNLNYYVTIDSNYRDREKYPLETDFGVTFETKDPSLQYPQGQPVDPTQFFPRVTIDKNFDSSNIRVLNGEITSITYDSNSGHTLYAGIQKTSGESNNFIIYNNTDIIFSQLQTISIAEISQLITNFQAFKDQLQLPFLFKLDSSNNFVWLVLGALSEVETQTYVGLNKTIDVSVEINSSGDYLLAFDYQSNLSFYKFIYENNSTTSINLGYNVVNPYGNGLAAYVVTAFNKDGLQLITNGTPWGYHNFYTTFRAQNFTYTGTNCSSPFNIYSTLPDNNTKNCIKSDKGNGIYVGVNIDNITPSYTRANLDGPTGYTGTTNTPIYYPDTTATVNKWQPLSYSFTDGSYYYPVYPTQYYRTISGSIVICNTITNDSSYTGTSILFPVLLQKELPVRNISQIDYDANFQQPQQYQRFFVYATGTYTSGASTTYKGNVCYTNIDRIFTASFYPPEGINASASGRIFCDNKPFSSNIATINVLNYSFAASNGSYSLIQEQTYAFPPPGSGILTIFGLSAIQYIGGGPDILLVMSRSDNVTRWLTALTYNTTTFTFALYANLVTAFQYDYVGAYNDTINGLMVAWATSNNSFIEFYNISGGVFNSVGSLNPGVTGNRAGMRVYERRTGPGSSQTSYYFTLSIGGVQYTYLINVAAGPVFSFTLTSTCDGKNISNYNWFDRKNYKEYLITSNPELAVYSFYNNILGNQVGQNNQIESFNSIYYAPETYTSGDLYATTVEPNTIVASWGSLLQNPELVSSHVYQNPKITITLPKDILTTATFQLNGRLYVVYAYDLPITFPVYLYIYDITDINNYIFIGTISTDSTVLPIVRINAIGFNDTVFILCESTVTKCIIFTIDNVEAYTPLTIDTVGGSQKYSNFLVVDNELYIYQAKASGANLEITKYKYNGSSFPLDNTALISSGYGSVTVHQVADLYYFLNNQYKILVLISDGSSTTTNYDIVFVDFNNVSSVTYTINTPLQQETAGTLMTVQFNELNYTNQIFFNYEYSPTINYIAIYEVPAELSNISLTSLLNSNIPVPFSGIQAKFSTLYNVPTDEIFLVVQTLSGIAIYNTTNPTSVAFLAQLDNVLYNTINSIVTTVYGTTSYAIITYKNVPFSSDEEYYSDIIQITNPSFAQNYNLPTRVETTNIIYGKGPSAVVKLNYEGQTQWINGIGDVYPYTGQYGELDSQYCNIAGLVLNNSELSIAASTSWVSKIAEVNYQKTFESNLLTNPFNAITAINACIFKFRTDNGNAEYALPIEGVLNTYITNPVNLNDNFTVSPTFNGSNLYIYIPQTSRTTNLTTLSNPITIQKTLTNITYQTASVVSLSQSGVLSWTSVIQSQNKNSYVFSYTIGSVNNTLTVLTTTFQDNVNIYDNSNNIVQVVYPFQQTASTNYIINLRYNSTGTYLESDSIESPNIPSLVPLSTHGNNTINKIFYSNSITTYSTGSPDSLYYRNKDGTLGHVDEFVGQNIYYVKEFLLNPGVYTRQIPTGCIGAKIKLWGAGGCSPSNSLINSWTAFGGGGGFAERQLTYPEGTPFNVKIGQAGNGGRSVLNSSLTQLGGFGGESSYCHSYIDGTWYVEIVAGGGGGAGAGATGTLFLSTGSNGGSAGYNGNRGYTNVTPSVVYPGKFGINGGGGLGGDIAGVPPVQNGRNFITYSSNYYSTIGTGGTSSYDGSPSAYTFVNAGGAGGAGYGGGGAGDPGANNLGLNMVQSCGGGGGGSYGSRVVNRYSNEANWLPANSADIDFYALNPLALAGVFNYSQGGWPTLNILGNYNPTGGNGLGVIYYYYSSNTGLTGAAYNVQSAISVYDYDSTFIDQNLKTYSSLTVYKNSSNINDTFTPFHTGAQTGSYTNYYTYILGTGANTPLNKNFLIRNNFFNNDEYTIVLDQKIDTTKLTRTYSLIDYDPNSIYFYSSNISKTPINSVISITGSNPLVVNYTSSPINLRDKYYVLCQTSTGSVDVITVNSISQSGTNYYIYYTGTNQCTGSYVYLSKFNKSALWNLQFNPTSIYTPVYYQVTLQRLTIPNRPIKNGPNPGVRYLTDYPYVFLQVYNTNDDDEFDPENINNIYTNNPNGPPVGGYDQNPTAYPNNSVYTIDIATSPGGEANFLFFSSGFVPRLKFTPGYYNIKLRLLDPEGNVILFDNTPTKSSDSVFSGVVDPSLMRMVAQLVFKKAS